MPFDQGGNKGGNKRLLGFAETAAMGLRDDP
jgi:hypothetical protein